VYVEFTLCFVEYGRAGMVFEELWRD